MLLKPKKGSDILFSSSNDRFNKSLLLQQNLKYCYVSLNVFFFTCYCICDNVNTSRSSRAVLKRHLGLTQCDTESLACLALWNKIVFILLILRWFKWRNKTRSLLIITLFPRSQCKKKKNSIRIYAILIAINSWKIDVCRFIARTI